MTLKLIIGVAVAAAAWGVMFLPRRDGFWPRAGGAALVIGAYAVAVEPSATWHLLDQRRWAPDLGVGLAAGLILYAVFWVGEQLLVIVFPRLAAEVNDLYSVRGRTRPWAIPVVVAVAGAGEELFFRGLVQHQAGIVVALVVYGAVHLWERKVILILAALVGGVWWGGLFAWTGGLVAPLASHLVWGLLIIVVHPAQPTAWAGRTSARLRTRLHSRA